MGKKRVFGALACWCVCMASPLIADADTVWEVKSGSTSFSFESAVLEEFRIASTEILQREEDATKPIWQGRVEAVITNDSTLTMITREGGPAEFLGGTLEHNKGLSFVSRNGAIRSDRLTIAHFGSPFEPALAIQFETPNGVMTGLILSNLKIGFDPTAGVFLVEAGSLVATPELADALGKHELSDRSIGSMYFRTELEWVGGDQPQSNDIDHPSDSSATGGIGPDVIVGFIYDERNWGSENGIAAFSIGTTSCNLGDEDLLWIRDTNEHPVIGQNMYRLKDSKFEHIGQSWLKHGFTSVNGDECGLGCDDPNTGSRLGPGCSDPYSAWLNGSQHRLGPKFQVNAYTGYYPYPFFDPSYSGEIARRLQVHHSDLDPNQNGGGEYFVEAQYIAADDAAAGNGVNNASYRPINVSGGGNSWSIALQGSTQQRSAGIYAWSEADPGVSTRVAPVPDEGIFIVGVKVTDNGNGTWNYEYAVQNLNSDRGAGFFSVPVPNGANITNIGFHDVDYHSGEPFDGTDWSAQIVGGQLVWSTESYDTNPDANALRWGTLYNFRFDADAAPDTSNVTIGLFKPGSPDSVVVQVQGPAFGLIDCNENGVADDEDIANGTSFDCNGNGVPDECEFFVEEDIAAQLVASGFSQPVGLYAVPGDLNRLFIVEQNGRIKIIENGSTLPTPFLNIASKISTGGERGLLGLAFHPDYGNNGYFYVNYTNTSGNTVIERYSVSGDPNIADSSSNLILKTINQDFGNHNGGQLAFGPDGMLYVGMGDGGSGGDPLDRSQNPQSLLGKMLRLDVENPPSYVAVDNPFVDDNTTRDEIWALGVRNPWRFSFDRLTGDMYIGDVGQNAHEEIDFEPANSGGGLNYGWRCYEGDFPYNTSGCGPAGDYVFPIVDVPHSSGVCSITGGFVYRGCELPGLSGTYFYADWCADWIRSFRYVDGQVTDQQDRTAQLGQYTGTITSIVSFGEDAAGELYIVSAGGSIYKIVEDAGGEAVCGNGIVEPGEECDPPDGVTCDENCMFIDNDECVNAAPVFDGETPFSNSGATTDGPDEPGVCSAFGYTHVESDIWYCYTASCTGDTTVSLCGSGYDTKVAVYEGCECPIGPSAIVCNDDSCDGTTQSEVNFGTIAGQRYLIRIGGYNGAQGNGTLNISCDGVPLRDCNDNGVDDSIDISNGDSNDCNSNDTPDECDVTDGTSDDCTGGVLGSPDGGELLIGTYCFGCHGPDGAGGPDLPGPNLRGKSRVQLWNKLTPPTDHPGGGFPGFTEQDFADIESFLSDTGSGARPDLIPDECQQWTDCNNNNEDDACDLANALDTDYDFDGILDGCELDGDCDNSGVVQPTDLANWAECATGPSPDQSLYYGCVCLDMDGDGDIDMHDFYLFQQAYPQ